MFIVSGQEKEVFSLIWRMRRGCLTQQGCHYRLIITLFQLLVLVGTNSTITPNGIGWSIAKAIAENNGPKLAHFMLDYKITCPDTDIRVIAHSLGAKVILNTFARID